MENNDTLKTDLILLLLYAKGASGKLSEPITGITRLMKLLFLLKKEGKVDDAFKFEPYKMGPFSSEVYPEIEFLKNYPTPDSPLISTKSVDNNSEIYNPEQIKMIEDISFYEEEPLSSKEINTEFNLTDLGKKIAVQLWDSTPAENRLEIENIKTKYSSMTLKDLLRYVYKTYPDMTTKSEIKDQLI
jgi:hypothetical protein